jgi:predicted TIM-barrel fold metal-dependent hydrolase
VNPVKKVIVAVFAIFGLVSAAGAQETQLTITPIADHHQHLLSPAGAAWLNRVPSPLETLPPEVGALLRERARRWNDPASLARLYTAATPVLSDLEPQFLLGGAAAKYIGTRFARPFDLSPRAFKQVGEVAHVAGFYTRGTGADFRRLGNFYMRLEKTSGTWLIAAEIPTFPGPASEAPVDVEQMIKLLDAAGIRRAALLSVAYWFDSGPEAERAKAYSAVRAENDWTAAQAAKFPGRLVAFCSFNALANHALQELRRCAATGHFAGVKLHFASSRVDLTNPTHLAHLKKVFRLANELRLPIVAHTNGAEGYGAEHVRILLRELLPLTPNVVVQIAHLWGGEGYSSDAIKAFADAIEARDPATKNLRFDVSDVALAVSSPAAMEEIAALMRRIGLERLFYGSDAPFLNHPLPKQSWEAFRQMPLTAAELRIIANNVAPYFR